MHRDAPSSGRPDVFLFSQDRAARPEPHDALSISMSFGSRALLMCRMRQLAATRLSFELDKGRKHGAHCLRHRLLRPRRRNRDDATRSNFASLITASCGRGDRALCAADVGSTCSHVAGSSGKSYRALPDRWLHRRSIPHFGRTPQDKLGQPSCNAGPRINWRNSFDTAGPAWSMARFPVPVRSEASAMPAHHRLRRMMASASNNLPTISDPNATRVETARTRAKIDLMRPKFLPSMHGAIPRRHASRIHFTIGTGSALHLLIARRSLVKV
jgi:hypothetical protein